VRLGCLNEAAENDPSKNINGHDWFYRLNVAIGKSPATCLAQVKAEAGRAGFIAGYHKMHIEFVGSIAPTGSAEHAADQYAERIKKQGDKP